jgi:preprotein translocase subunit SecD
MGWTVGVQLSKDGSDALASATRAAVGSAIGIVVDGLVVSAPTVAEPITAGAVVVAGGLSENEAERLASSLGG